MRRTVSLIISYPTQNWLKKLATKVQKNFLRCKLTHGPVRVKKELTIVNQSKRLPSILTWINLWAGNEFKIESWSRKIWMFSSLSLHGWAADESRMQKDLLIRDQAMVQGQWNNKCKSDTIEESPMVTFDLRQLGTSFSKEMNSFNWMSSIFFQIVQLAFFLADLLPFSNFPQQTCKNPSRPRKMPTVTTPKLIKST